MKPVQLPKSLEEVDDFFAEAMKCIEEEIAFEKKHVQDTNEVNQGFQKIDIKQSRIEKSVFQSCSFERAGFVDVIFEGVDFSNSTFHGAYFERCSFKHCKCVGIVMSDTIFKDVLFEECNLQFSFFHKSRMTEVMFDGVDFTEASLTEAKLKQFHAKQTRFIKNNFYLTSLEKVDFTDNELMAPTVSTPPVELRGAIINMAQAADLIKLWGLIVS